MVGVQLDVSVVCMSSETLGPHNQKQHQTTFLTPCLSGARGTPFTVAAANSKLLPTSMPRLSSDLASLPCLLRIAVQMQLLSLSRLSRVRLMRCTLHRWAPMQLQTAYSGVSLCQLQPFSYHHLHPNTMASTCSRNRRVSRLFVGLSRFNGTKGTPWV